VQVAESRDKDEVFAALKKLQTVALVDFDNENQNTFIVNSNNDQSSRKEIFNMCVNKKWILTEMTPIETKLEDIFRELTTAK